MAAAAAMLPPLLLAVLLASAPAHAQEPAQPPPPPQPPTTIDQLDIPQSIDPGQLRRRFETPLQPLSRGRTLVPEVLDTSRPPAGAERISFVLEGIRLEGNTVFSSEDLMMLYQEYLGKEVSLARVYEIANAITAHYRSAGYLLSQVVVPAQELSRRDEIRFRVIEGFIDEVIIEGKLKRRDGLLKSMGELVKASRPLKVDVLERYLLLADDLPGATVRGVLRPSPGTVGAANLVLVVTHDVFQGFVSSNNRGSRLIGPIQISSGLTFSSLLGMYEKTDIQLVRTTQSDELSYERVLHEQVISPTGTRAGIELSKSISEPGSNLVNSGIESEGETVMLYFSHPLIRLRRQNLTFRMEAEHKNFFVSRGSVRIGDDRLRILRTGLSYDFVDALSRPSVTLINLQLSKGFDALGMPDGIADRSIARVDFYKATLEMTHTHRLGGGLSIQVEASGQYSPHPLLSGEKFAYGGSRFGRGLDPSELTGDEGAAVKWEFQYQANPNRFWLRNYQAYALADFGAVWNNDFSETTYSGVTAGFGLRLFIRDWLTVSMEVARPLAVTAPDPSVEDNKDVRRYFGIVLRL